MAGSFQNLRRAICFAMRPIFTLIDTRHWYVIANFRETDLKNIRSGTPATIRLMSDSGKTFEGKVDSIGYGVLTG